MSTTKVYTGKVTDEAGQSSQMTVTITSLSAPVIDGLTATPASAPAGTSRVIDMAAHSPDGLAVTYELRDPNGNLVTPVPGIPNRWNVVV